SSRRHTCFSRDWSSDVCSSDLPPLLSGTECCADDLVVLPHLVVHDGSSLLRSFAAPVADLGWPERYHRMRALPEHRPRRDETRRSEERRVGKEYGTEVVRNRTT